MSDSTMSVTATLHGLRGWSATAAQSSAEATSVRSAGEAIHTFARVHLDDDDLLRIHDGEGTVVRALSGVVWITEERSIEDTVLLSGEAHRIQHQGLTLALAHRESRVVLQIAEGNRAPRTVTVAMPGDRLRRVPLPFPARSQRSPTAAAIATIRRAVRGAARALSRRATRFHAQEDSVQSERRLAVPYY
jgi:hypothetical protein